MSRRETNEFIRTHNIYVHLTNRDRRQDSALSCQFSVSRDVSLPHIGECIRVFHFEIFEIPELNVDVIVLTVVVNALPVLMS